MSRHHRQALKWRDKRMNKYYVSFNCVYSDVVVAQTPEEATDLVKQIIEQTHRFDISGLACVTEICKRTNSTKENENERL